MMERPPFKMCSPRFKSIVLPSLQAGVRNSNAFNIARIRRLFMFFFTKITTKANLEQLICVTKTSQFVIKLSQKRHSPDNVANRSIVFL